MILKFQLVFIVYNHYPTRWIFRVKLIKCNLYWYVFVKQLKNSNSNKCDSMEHCPTYWLYKVFNIAKLWQVCLKSFQQKLEDSNNAYINEFSQF
jgi:hypothetical protein